jgi:hypothetical protein
LESSSHIVINIALLIAHKAHTACRPVPGGPANTPPQKYFKNLKFAAAVRRYGAQGLGGLGLAVAPNRQPARGLFPKVRFFIAVLEL